MFNRSSKNAKFEAIRELEFENGIISISISSDGHTIAFLDEEATIMNVLSVGDRDDDDQVDSELFVQFMSKLVVRRKERLVIDSDIIELMITTLSLEGNEEYIHGTVHILWMTACSKNGDLMDKALSKFNYLPWLYDTGYDPFDLALELNDSRILDSFAAYFEENDQYLEMTSSKFIQCLKSSSEKMRLLAISLTFVEGVSISNMPGSAYGSEEEFMEFIPSVHFQRDDVAAKYFEQFSKPGLM